MSVAILKGDCREVTLALQQLMDCSRAIVGADHSDPRSAEAYEMYWDAMARARAALRGIPNK